MLVQYSPSGKSAGPARLLRSPSPAFLLRPLSTHSQLPTLSHFHCLPPHTPSPLCTFQNHSHSPSYLLPSSSLPFYPPIFRLTLSLLPLDLSTTSHFHFLLPPSTLPLRCSPASWAAAHGIPYRSSTAVQNYILSLYWASATLTSVGYGDVSAHDEREMVFALVVQLTGIMLYGYCLGVIAATLTNAASFRSVHCVDPFSPIVL